jgi:hypothetical protein
MGLHHNAESLNVYGTALKELQKWQRQFVPLITLLSRVNNELHYKYVTTPPYVPSWHRVVRYFIYFYLIGTGDEKLQTR